MAALFHLLKLDLVNVNMYKVLIVLIYTVPALLIFVWAGTWTISAGSSRPAAPSADGWP